MSPKEIRIVSTPHSSPIKHLALALYINKMSKSLWTQDEELGRIFFHNPCCHIQHHRLKCTHSSVNLVTWSGLMQFQTYQLGQNTIFLFIWLFAKYLIQLRTKCKLASGHIYLIAGQHYHNHPTGRITLFNYLNQWFQHSQSPDKTIYFKYRVYWN